MAKHFSEKELMREYSGDIEILSEVVEVLKSETPERFAKLKESFSQSNFQEMELQAHSVKGSFKLFYAGYIIDLCQKIENAGRNKVTDGVEETMNSLFALYPYFLNELIHFISKSQKVV